MAAGCKIIKEFCRPEKDLVMRFKDMPVANIDDNMGRVAAVDNPASGKRTASWYRVYSEGSPGR